MNFLSNVDPRILFGLLCFGSISLIGIVTMLVATSNSHSEPPSDRQSHITPTSASPSWVPGKYPGDNPPVS